METNPHIPLSAKVKMPYDPTPELIFGAVIVGIFCFINCIISFIFLYKIIVNPFGFLLDVQQLFTILFITNFIFGFVIIFLIITLIKHKKWISK